MKRAKMKRLRFILPVFALMLVMALPMPVFATAPPEGAAGGTMQVEFRHAEGETPDIPQQITRFGFVYHLVSVSEPVAEGELPTVRTYTYQISGAISEQQKRDIKGLGDLNLIEKYILMEEEVDVIDVTDRPTNDIDEIETQKVFTVLDATENDPDNTTEKLLKMTGVTFSDLQYDQYGRPSGYKATAVYRGMQTIRIFAYYMAEATFTTYEEEEGTSMYVVVADYVTDEMPPPIDEEEPEVIAPVEEPEGPGSGLIPIDEELVALQSGNPIADIFNGLVPLGGINISGFWSVFSMLFSFGAVGMAVVFAIGAAYRKRRADALMKLGVHDPEKISLIRWRGIILRFLTIVLGAITFLTWFLLDNFNSGMVWANQNTPLVGALLGITVLLCVLTNIRSRKTISDDEDDGSEENLSVDALPA